MSFSDPADNIISQLTTKGRNLATRSSIEGLSFQFLGWALGRGGYDPVNPVKILTINPNDTTLIDQIYPTIPFLNPFSPSDLETPTYRTVSCACRIVRDTFGANYGIGEIGIWIKILNSPLNPLENNEQHLFSITHMPIQTITANTAKIYRIINNF